MTKVLPEDVGISSKSVLDFIKSLEDGNLSTHSVILAKGNKIFYEKYWEPYTEKSLQRMYSVTKSFVSLAVGFLEQDGIISLDDKIVKYFEKEAKGQKDENFRNQTIRDMLMMSNAKPAANWFEPVCDDRVKLYFQNSNKISRPSGLIFQYDSMGSFVLGALVERLTNMKLLDYLRIKFLNKTGFSKEAYILECPGGHSWSDSGLVCSSRDLLLVGQFLLNKGKWNGKQLLNEKYIIDATSKQIDNNPTGANYFNTNGYGYLFWICRNNSYAMFGMGCQYLLCVPDQSLIMVITSDNQGKEYGKDLIFRNFFSTVAGSCLDFSAEDTKTYRKELKEYSDRLKLAVAKGNYTSSLIQKINGKKYILNANPMGIKDCTFRFENGEGKMEYTNEQGKKTLTFGIGKNVFSLFPQEGYSDTVGSVPCKGNKYKCCASASFPEENKLFLKIQIIDKYLGTLDITAAFKENEIALYMTKCAENFLNEYQGFAGGKEA